MPGGAQSAWGAATTPRHSPYDIILSPDEAHELHQRSEAYTRPYAEVVRARVVLYYAAEGLRNDEIAARLDLSRVRVSKWRKRFFEQRLEGLRDRPRSGRPRSFSPCGGDAGQSAGL